MPTSGTTPRPADGSSSPTEAPPAEAPTTGSLSDRKGDVSFSLDRPPAWADIVGATVARSASAYEVRIALGGPVPSTYERERTINVASFFDVDGDGSVDYEVWANLASGGWGGSYFDNTRPRGGRFNDESLVITPVGSELVVAFPVTHLASARTFQWAVGTEWGRYETLGTAASARDEAPDDDGAAVFPGK